VNEARELLPARYRLIGATVVDPVCLRARTSSINVENDRIVRNCTAEFTEVNAGNLFVLPGLINMHVHLVPSLNDGRALTDEILTGCRSTLADALRSGVTTVRDVGGDLAVLLALRIGQISGAFCGSRVVLGGPALCAPAGHGMHGGHGIAAANAKNVVTIVQALAGAGVDHIKLVTSGARGAVQLQPDVLVAAVAAARESNLPVAVHAHFQAKQLATSVNAQVTSIEHGFLLHRTPHLLDRMAATGIFLCPTLRVIEAIREDPFWYGQNLIPGAWPDALNTVTAAHAAGVQLLAGTDSGVFGVHPGELWREISLLGQLCGSRWAGLQAATCTAGIAMGRNDLGNFHSGAVADFVLLRRDPVVDDVDDDDVVAVIQNGRLVAGTLSPLRTDP
jgi:imidazolonepropionase-like amidohydrolase